MFILAYSYEVDIVYRFATLKMFSLYIISMETMIEELK
jgi:hypothetical protein